MFGYKVVHVPITGPIVVMAVPLKRSLHLECNFLILFGNAGKPCTVVFGSYQDYIRFLRGYSGARSRALSLSAPAQ